MDTKADVVVFAPIVPDAVEGRFRSADGTMNGTTVRIPLKDLDEFALERLCVEFREKVFSTAGKTPPARAL